MPRGQAPGAGSRGGRGGSRGDENGQGSPSSHAPGFGMGDVPAGGHPSRSKGDQPGSGVGSAGALSEGTIAAMRAQERREAKRLGFEERMQREKAKEIERTHGLVDTILGIGSAALGFLGKMTPQGAALAGGAMLVNKAVEVGRELANTDEGRGMLAGLRGDDPAVQAATGRTPTAAPGARGEGGDRRTAAARPGSAPTAADPTTETPPTNPLAGITDPDESTYWRPQPVSGDVDWLARVNADIERSRQAGRQRAMV